MGNAKTAFVCRQWILGSMTLVFTTANIAMQKKSHQKSMRDKLVGTIYERKTELEFEYK